MKLGFIGSGFEPKNITVSGVLQEQLDGFMEKYGVLTTTDNVSVAADSDVLFLCVKPNVIYAVADEIKESIGKDTVVVSIAAGQSLEKLKNALACRRGYDGNDI